MSALISAVIISFAIFIFFLLLFELLWHLFWKPNNWWQKWQEPKVITLFHATENGKKLLNYIQQHNIKLEIPLWTPPDSFWSCYTVLFQSKSVLIINKKDLSLMPQKNGEVESSIAHELGHLAIENDSFLDISICPYAEKDFSSESCPYQEFLAWKRGWQILQELDIQIDENQFWQWAKRAIKTYSLHCSLSNFELCEKLMADKESSKLFK